MQQKTQVPSSHVANQHVAKQHLASRTSNVFQHINALLP
jgi:hypothetical protein